MRAIGIVLAGGNAPRMKELTNKRAVAAMPLAGSYRAVDFALSSLANSKVQKVAVLTQYNSRSLNDHMSSSKWWDFGRKQGGLFVFTPTITADNGFWYRGTADSIFQNIEFLRDSHEPYVVIASAAEEFTTNYQNMLGYVQDMESITYENERMVTGDGKFTAQQYAQMFGAKVGEYVMVDGGDGLYTIAYRQELDPETDNYDSLINEININFLLKTCFLIEGLESI